MALVRVACKSTSATRPMSRPRLFPGFAHCQPATDFLASTLFSVQCSAPPALFPHELLDALFSGYQRPLLHGCANPLDAIVGFTILMASSSASASVPAAEAPCYLCFVPPRLRSSRFRKVVAARPPGDKVARRRASVEQRDWAQDRPATTSNTTPAWTSHVTPTSRLI